MKRKDSLKELRGLDAGKLKEKHSELQRELMNLRFRHASGQLTHTGQLSAVKKSIARAATVLREKSS